ncbi:hypothetical protein LTR36_003864 [Oleoguttula mirabilis]|uniref:Ubiquitin-like protease family profile domain-containing protein n=1 Tax=Oleoguttula mirabilis TaxID=1507867 RepID=A0AAV9JHS8_9PEZI|nr:hypothetical protein LTR36_003864 [Oleoguttula mirabilis]
MSSRTQDIDGSGYHLEVVVRNHEELGPAGPTGPPPPHPSTFSPLPQYSDIPDPSESDLSSIHWSLYGMQKPTKTPARVVATPGTAPAASPIPQASSGKLGKRSFADFEGDLLDEPYPQSMLQSTPLNLLQRNAALKGRMSPYSAKQVKLRSSPASRTGYTPTFQHPPPPPAVRMIYGCVAFVSHTAQQGCGLLSRFAAWFRPQQVQVEIVAVETPSGNKRRAIALEDMPGHFPTPSALITPPDSRPSSSSNGEESKMLDVAAQESRPSSSSAVEQPETSDVAAPAAAPDTPESRPTSSHSDGEHNQPKDVVASQTEPRTQEAMAPTNGLPQSKTSGEQPAIKQAIRKPMRTCQEWLVDQRERQAAREARVQTPYVPQNQRPAPSVQLVQLPAYARPQRKYEDREAHEAARDKEINDLCVRAQKVALDTPAVFALKNSYRRNKWLAEIERAEKAERVRAEAEKVEKERAEKLEKERTEQRRVEAEEAKAQEAAIQAQLEEEARIQDERQAEEASKKAEEAAKLARHELIRPLDLEWDTKVKEAMQVKSDRHVMVTSTDGVSLTKHDFESLLPAAGQTHASAWLNDEIVNAWFSAIVETKAKQTGYDSKNAKSVPAVAAFQTGWHTTYKSKGINGIARWSRRMGVKGDKLLSAEKIIFPINTGAHWMLLLISPQAKTIEYLDSLCGTGKAYFKVAREWLALELGVKYDADEWQELKTRSSLQSNTDDCGAFTCLNGLAAAKGRSFSDVQAEKMQHGRRMMGAVLLNGGFHGDWEL